MRVLKRKVNTVIRKACVEDGLTHYLKIIFDRVLFAVFYRHLYKRVFSHYGKNVRWGKHGHFKIIPKSIRVEGTSKIHLSDNVRIDDFVYLQANTNGEGIYIGHNSRLNANVHIQAFSKIHIGNHVLIAPFSHINSGNHSFNRTDLPIMYQSHTGSGPITINDGSWLGHSTTILGNTYLSENSVVGANTLVKGQYFNTSIHVGCRSRQIAVENGR
ncbi:acyltransferase [Vibrio cholerae]|uniref:acyltransferase n=1 Tax=Vibrio TaxID=662 RepID=UPI000DE4E282|nr:MULTISPECIES: acyltransferase [Vibrio]EGQ9613021.1 hypothetical protein [Vibrio cholerae]QEO44556.1 hypothetical protein F0315_04190 [Vibrio cholerae]QKU64102.1 hypothetical protein HPY17_12610 [Vibrio cholerae]QKU67985.1 hypothetical protein HPY10_12650 [Vibrio cholerae]RBM35401.1 hypothetical protein DLR58_05510 [Vibrio tarriae]